MSWLFPSLRGYRRDWLRGDVLARLTVWAVLVPEALAYASIAGVSPVIGLCVVERLLARDVGQVRDVLRTAAADGALTRVYPSVRAAVDSLAGRLASSTPARSATKSP